MSLNFYEMNFLIENKISTKALYSNYGNEDLVKHLWRRLSMLDKLDIRHPHYGKLLQGITELENELKRRGVEY